MKNHNKLKIFLLATLAFVQPACKKSLDLKPLDQLSDAAYWTKPSDFKTFANQYYGYLRNFGQLMTDNPHYDGRADIFNGGGAYGAGTNTLVTSDGNWNGNYTKIRNCNYLLDRAANYANAADIATYVAEAKFFRAYCYFDLLQLYGEVPLVTKLLTLDDPSLYGPRATRDEVVDQIVADLEAASANLPATITTSSADYGRLTKAAAQAFLGRVTLYEATWQKFRSGNATRYNTLFDKSIAASNAVMTTNQYALFGTAANDALGGGSSVILGDSAMKYMFILENPKSNPASITKAANHEYVLSYRYDDVLKPINVSVSRMGNAIGPQQKWVNAPVCNDGLPIEKSPKFQGFATYGSQFANRDNRLRYSIKVYGMYYWYGAFNPRVTWLNDAPDRASSLGQVTQVGGYGNQKWMSERAVPDQKESEDYPVIRYAEVLLNYAEAVYERNGAITDADLNKSLNLVRLRANQKNGMPPLTNAFVTTNGLDMRTEIRRERFVELYFENFRFDDIKRWHSAGTDLVSNTGGTAYGNVAGFVSPWPISIRYKGTQAELGPNALSPKPSNALDANGNLILDQTARSFTEKNYLYPIPTTEITLNPQLKQNPGW